MIYTSYYACPLIDRETMHLVQISNSIPKGFTLGGKLCSAVPDWKNIVEPYKTGQIDRIQYRQRYVNQLDGSQFMLLLELDEEIKKSGGKDVVLFCYEKPADFCHRHILAEYLNNCEAYTGEKIEELSSKEPTLF